LIETYDDFEKLSRGSIEYLKVYTTNSEFKSLYDLLK